MSDETWDEQFKRFLRKTGEDFRRASDDVKAEAQRLFDAAMDQEKQQKVRDRLNELSLWARKAAQGVAGAVEEAASKAETAFHSATERMMEASGKASATKRAPSTAARKPAATAKRASGAKNAPGKRRPKKGGKRKR